MKRSDVQPFSIAEARQIIATARPDYRNYFVVRILTGMRTAETHGLKWKYIDFERRLILVRESIVLDEEDELKTDGSLRDIQMTQLVYDALQAQHVATAALSEYVFCNQAGQPINNQNFVNRVWSPLLRHLGLAHRRAYQMRHTAATLWLASGEAPEWIARQLGHTNSEMLFRVYSRYVPNLTRQDGSAMERLLASQMSSVNLLAQKVPASDLAVDASAQVVEHKKPVHESQSSRNVRSAASDDNAGATTLGNSPPIPWHAQTDTSMLPLASGRPLRRLCAVRRIPRGQLGNHAGAATSNVPLA
jgi:integrase